MSSKQRLLDLINNSNFPAVPLTADNVEFQNVQPAAGGSAWNTQVDVVAKTGGGYEGERTLFYRRLDLSILPKLTFSVTTLAGDPQALLDAINTALGPDLGLEDLQAFALPAPAAGQTLDCVLSAAPGSLRWIGTGAMSISGSAVVCEAPAPLPTLQVNTWWTSVNKTAYLADANPYGNIFVEQTPSSITQLDDTGLQNWRKRFTSQKWNTSIGLQTLTHHQQDELAQLVVTNPGGAGVALAQVNRTTGAVNWSVEAVAPAAGVVGAGALATQGGCIFAAMRYLEASNTHSSVLAMLRSNASVVWQRQLNAPIVEGHQTDIQQVVVDSAENVYAVVGEITNADVYLVKFDKQGTLLWQWKIDDLSSHAAIALDEARATLYLAGFGSAGGSMVLRLSAQDGARVWALPIPYDNVTTNHVVQAVAADAAGALYVLTAGGLLKFDSTGSLISGWVFSSPNAEVSVPLGGLTVRGDSLYLVLNDNTNDVSVVLNLPADFGAGAGSYVFGGTDFDVNLNSSNGVTTIQPGAAVPAGAGTYYSVGDLQDNPGVLVLSVSDIQTVDDLSYNYAAPQALPTGFAVDASVSGGTLVTPAPAPAPPPPPANPMLTFTAGHSVHDSGYQGVITAADPRGDDTPYGSFVSGQDITAAYGLSSPTKVIGFYVSAGTVVIHVGGDTAVPPSPLFTKLRFTDSLGNSWTADFTGQTPFAMSSENAWELSVHISALASETTVFVDGTNYTIELIA